jgi:hypothetical protein
VRWLMSSNSVLAHLRVESSSGDFEGVLDAEIASDFDGEMNDGLTVVPDMEMLNSRRI